MWLSEKAAYVIHWVKHKNQSAKISLFVIATQAFFKPIIKELPPAIFRGHFHFLASKSACLHFATFLWGNGRW